MDSRGLFRSHIVDRSWSYNLVDGVFATSVFFCQFYESPKL